MDEEKKFIINETQVKEINYHLDNHSTIAIRSILKQLPLLEEKIDNKKLEKEEENGSI